MRQKLWQQLSLATLLVIGLACLWGMLAGWGISMFEATSAYQFTETLAVNEQGEAYVLIQHYGETSQENTYRTLEGAAIPSPNKKDQWISPASLKVPYMTKTGELAGNWNRRIYQVARTRQQGSPAWYLVHNGEDLHGRAYLVGYSHISNYPIGYYGREGFSESLPPHEQWFHLDGRTTGSGRGGLAVTGAGYYAMAANGQQMYIQSHAENDSNPPIFISLATSEGLMVINLKTQSLWREGDAGACLSVSECNIPHRFLAKDSLPDGVKISAAQAEADPKLAKHFLTHQFRSMVGRRAKKIITFTSNNHNSTELINPTLKFTIPPELRQQNFSIYFISPEQAVIDVPQNEMLAHTSELYWINSAGEIQKTETVLLNQGREQNGLSSFAALSLLAPIPLFVVIFAAVFLPFQHPYNITAATYLERFATVCTEAWPAVLVLVIVAALMAWWVLRRQQNLSRPTPVAWASFVLLLGLPAFVIYRILYPRPALSSCKNCGASVPHDHDACAHCQQSFPEPSLLGTEVFA